MGSLLVVSCHKSTQIGSNLLSDKSWHNGIFTDTVKLHARPVREDSVLASSLSFYVLGSVNDPKFGTTTSGLFTQTILPSASLALGPIDSLRFDSLVLCLAYNSSSFPGTGFGPFTQNQTIKVYQVTDPMNSATIYYSNDKFNINPIPLGSRTFKPDFVDSITVGHSKRPNFPAHIRVRLDSVFGKNLLAKSSNGYFTGQADFLTFLQGLYIAPDTTKGMSDGLMYVNPSNTPSGMVLYYRRIHSNGTIDTLNTTFTIDNSCAKCNHFTHTYISGITKALNNPVSDSILYIQGLGGINTALTLPPLSYFANKIISKAEVMITQVYDPNASDTLYFPPEQLFIVKYDSLKHKIDLPDLNQSYLTYGGNLTYVYDAQHHKLAQYKISIAGYVQDLLFGLNNQKYGLYITNELSNSLDLGRLVAYGNSKTSNFRLKFNFIYTPVK
jgi:hypothetical protein